MIVIYWAIALIAMIVNIIIFGIRAFFGGIEIMANHDNGTPYRKAKNKKIVRSLLFAIIAFIIWAKISIYALYM